MAEITACRRQHRAKVCQYLLRLRGHVAADDFAALGVNRNLPGGKHKAAADFRLRIRANRRRGFFGINRFHTLSSPLRVGFPLYYKSRAGCVNLSRRNTLDFARQAPLCVV
ncbi:hypothetical protein SDC9_164657 [bioreactor metagenome]|uniref:Uncharacterized protein n=1 Tax=bioreactor metagenome TaxID=1076179 RepID=A0A645FZL0_9ZZZZ